MSPVRVSSVRRCAIYCRKSSDEGLEQTFNSLAAQRECAEALIKSRRGEGWVVIDEAFEDGGYSGGNTERPALKRLMQRIEDGSVDVVVVYRLDRLTRSISDFGRLFESLQAKGVDLVSTTESLDTSTAPGRLMVHLLLSFAQYERELASERTRDKIAASRRKGMWTGGRPVLGYDFAGCKLIVNEAEASLVRRLFLRYLDVKSLGKLAAELSAEGVSAKRWRSKNGSEVGGGRLHKSALYRLLSNALYIGKVPHHGTLHPGAHEAIVDEGVFARVQQLLAANGRAGGTLTRNTYGGLLKGVLVCGCCEAPMVHSSTRTDAGVVHRYYVCRSRQMNGKQACGTKPVPAGQIEEFVLDKVKPRFVEPALVMLVFDVIRSRHEQQMRDVEARLAMHRTELAACERVLTRGPDVGATQRHARAAAALAGEAAELDRLQRGVPRRDEVERALREFDGLWAEMSPSERAELLRAAVARVKVRAGAITITLREQSEEAAA